MAALSEKARLTLTYLGSYLDEPPKWHEVPEADARELNERLRSLAAEVPGIEQACIPDRAIRIPANSSGPSVTTERFMRAVKHAQALIRQSAAAGQAGSSVDEAVAQRYQVLADLAQAYLKNAGEDIQVGSATSEGTYLHHPGFESGPYRADPVMAHLRALAAEGLIFWHPSPGSAPGYIGVHTDVLGAPDMRSAKTGREVQQVIHNYFGSNVAHGGQGHTMSVASGLQPGDLEGLVAALRGLGLRDTELAEVRAAAASDDGLERAEGFLRRVFEGAMANASGTTLTAAASNYHTALEAIHRFFGLI